MLKLGREIFIREFRGDKISYKVLKVDCEFQVENYSAYLKKYKRNTKKALNELVATDFDYCKFGTEAGQEDWSYEVVKLL